MENTPRERFEVIVDTCSMGEKKMRGVSAMIAYAMDRQPPVFDHYRIVVPLQLGTEARQRLFPEFLQKELSAAPESGGLERFYAEHKDHVRIVETESSLAFKLFYAEKAARILDENPKMHGMVKRLARQLANQYAEDGQPPVKISRQSIPQFKQQIRTLRDEYMQTFSEVQAAYIKEREAAPDPRALPPIGAELKRLKREVLAKTSEHFFNHCSPSDKLVLQALYSCKPMYARVSKETDFGSFRTDLGERAIEDYLYDKRAATDPRNVSLVVTEDRGARGSIQRLRGESNNSIFVVGSFGLSLALKQLHIIDNLFDVMEPALMTEVKARRMGTWAKKERGQVIGMDDVNEPEIERKWARRLVEVVNTGQWSEMPSRERPNRAAAGVGR